MYTKERLVEESRMEERVDGEWRGCEEKGTVKYVTAISESSTMDNKNICFFDIKRFLFINLYVDLCMGRPEGFRF